MNSLLPATPLTSEEADESAPHIAEDSSSETEIPELPKPISHSERRRLQEAKFGSWFEAKSESITLKSMNEDMGENDESRSTKYLIEKQEAAVIISDPREYQMELFERAKQQNIIAVLDTGSGKTLIAALLLRHVLNQEHEDRALNNPPRIAFFLVASVTLVFQQAAVLETNLHEKIDRFCGDMGCDLWSKAIWEKHFKENMVIVCTADVLYQCLMHSFISIEQINLLIFDEAHHAKKNHAYAKIIRDFYPEEDDPRRRPKIFGMTASPVDAKVDVYVAARELEILLKSHIATAADLTLLQKSVHRPTEKLIVYKKLEPPFSTKLFQKFSKLFGETQLYRRPFQTALLASSELGSWCSDRVWHYTLSVDGARKLEGTIRRDHGLGIIVARVGGADVLEDNLALVEEAKNYMKKSPMPPPQANLSDLSTKVLNLYNYLCLRYQAPTDDKCIVFVTHRFTARVLEDLFGFIGTPHLRVGALIGARSGEVNDIGSTFRKQVLTLTKFRKGLINCLAR
ncbi:MAG: Dicer-like protein 1 [Trizodia sp. TS-e1964]|nr:MAG: Dicer-like protein 1 [Trizodia sp. TS-e1964]